MELEEELKQAQILILAHRQFHAILKNMAQQQSDIQIINQLIQAIECLFPSKIGSVLLLDLLSNTLRLSHSVSKLPDEFNDTADGTPIHPKAGSCGAAAYFKTPFIVSDIYTHPNWQTYVELMKKVGLRACWSMPILSKDDLVLGTFAIYSPEAGEPNKYELEILETAAFVASVALDKKQLMMEACTDKLTTLNNRNHFEQSFEHLISIAERNEQKLGVVFMDLNKFKVVNDQLGHPEGDKVLIATANALKSCLRKTDISCRYGGDEFVFASINMDAHEIEKLCERIRNNLLDNVDITAKALGFGISFGGIQFSSTSDYHIDELIRLADIEMYHAKNDGTGISVKHLEDVITSAPNIIQAGKM